MPCSSERILASFYTCDDMCISSTGALQKVRQVESLIHIFFGNSYDASAPLLLNQNNL